MKNIASSAVGGECPYGKVCETSPCPGVRLELPAAYESALLESGLSVGGGFRPEHPHLGLGALSWASVEVCDRALEDPTIFDQITDLEPFEIDTSK